MSMHNINEYEQLVNAVHPGHKHQQNFEPGKLVEGVVEVVADTTELVMEAPEIAEGVAESVGAAAEATGGVVEVIGDALDGIEALPVVIITGAVAAVGGLIFLGIKAFKHKK